MSELTDLYQAVILDHNRRPRNKGTMDDADAHAEGRNPLCGDQLSVWVRYDVKRPLGPGESGAQAASASTPKALTPLGSVKM